MKSLLSIQAGILLASMAFATVVLAEDCSPTDGEKAFSACKTCHSTDKTGAHQVGPNLRGVVGRKAGGAEDFGYSPAFEDLDYLWTPERLGEFLENPMKQVPGTFMAFGGIKSEQKRRDLICYLEHLQ